MYTYPEKEKIAVVNRYLNDETILKISQTTKISRTTIYLWIKERNNSFNKGKAPDFRYLHDLQEKCDRQQKIIEILQRSPCTPSAPLSKRYEVIKSLSDEYTVNILCEALKVAKGSYSNHILHNKNGNTKAANRKSEMFPVIEQIKAAYETRKPTEILLFHSDQGSNYTSGKFRKYLKSLNIIQSFSNPGMPYDNSVMESFFGSFKREALYRYRFKTEKDFYESIETCINFYNNNRPHSVLINRTPDKFESKYFNNNNKKTNFETEQ